MSVSRSPAAAIRRSPLAAYRQIARDLRNRIAGGEFVAHERLPTEDELMARFGVSRHTVRSALQMLVNEGLLERYAGRGTFVVERPSRDHSWRIRSLDDIVNENFPADPKILYIYNSATSGVRKSDELAICSDGEPGANPDTALYSIDVIAVPLDHPEDAAIVNRPRIFADRETGAVAGLWMGGRAGVASQGTARTNHCHDITVFPEIGQAAGACSGNGILLDISDPKNPQRISDIFDPDMAYWHSATFANSGEKVVFTDEWGGGTSPRCTADAPGNWGANLVATITNGELRGRAFHKLPSVQGANENCVAHNGNIIPVPGRDLMVQAWYQGGISIMDFTDPMHPVEVAYFDRGPLGERLMIGGSWSAYWFNGRIYSSEIARGIDVLRLLPSDQMSASEIAAAEAVHMDVINPQTQTRVTWADTPDVAAAYLDQLNRTDGIEDALSEQVGAVITGWRRGRINASAAASSSASLKAAAAVVGVDPIAAGRMNALAEVLDRAAG